MKTIEKFSVPTLIVGMLNKKFLVFGIITYFFQKLGFNGQADIVKMTALIVWGIIGFSFMFSSSIEGLVENGKLNIELKAQAGPGGGK